MITVKGAAANRCAAWHPQASTHKPPESLDVLCVCVCDKMRVQQRQIQKKQRGSVREREPCMAFFTLPAQRILLLNQKL